MVSAERSDSRNHDKPLTQVEAIVLRIFFSLCLSHGWRRHFDCISTAKLISNHS